MVLISISFWWNCLPNNVNFIIFEQWNYTGTSCVVQSIMNPHVLFFGSILKVRTLKRYLRKIFVTDKNQFVLHYHAIIYSITIILSFVPWLFSKNLSKYWKFFNRVSDDKLWLKLSFNWYILTTYFEIRIFQNLFNGFFMIHLISYKIRFILVW